MIGKKGINSELAQLKIAYSEDSKLLTGYVNQLVHVNRVFPRHSPTQTSGRWSTYDPPMTNWPRQCINPQCPQYEHEWTDQCWSIRDILLADEDEVLITWDHDNIEGRIHDLIVNDTVALKAHQEGYDLHTITCCNIFGYPPPTDLRNPHTSEVDTAWRQQTKWQGKDTKQRVLAKNFNHGSKYTDSYRFVHKIQGIEKYGVTRKHLEELAKRYIESKGEAWQRKLAMMDKIRRERIARSLYGFRRVFFDSSKETGRQGFSHMVSATVSDYNNETLRLLEERLGDDCRVLHNAHDGDKLAIKSGYFDTWSSTEAAMKMLKAIIERPITYEGRSLVMTAGVKIYG